jgi:hypothetical protein
MDISQLSLRTRILLALAGLALENREKSFFSAKDINEWIEKRMPNSSAGRTRALLHKLMLMRRDKKQILNDVGITIGDVEEVSSVSVEGVHLYKLGLNTIGTPLSAKLLKKLYAGRGWATRTVSSETELMIVDEIYEEFKDKTEYGLTSAIDIKRIITEAVNAKYFIRTEDGLLEPTLRLMLDEHDYIESLADLSALSANVKRE